MLLDFAQKFSVFRTDRFKLRLDFVRYEVLFARRVKHFFHVKFVGNKGFQFVVEFNAGHVQFLQGLAVFDVRLISCGASQNDNADNFFHAVFERGVDETFVRHGERGQMHAFGRVFVKRPDKILINAFRHKRGVRRDKFRQFGKDGVKRHIRGDFVVGHFASPVSFATATNVPVGKFVHEVLNFPCAFENLIFVQAVVHVFDKAVEPRKHPSVHDRQFAIFKVVFRRIELVDIGVKYKERIGVPERAHEFTLRLADGFGIEPRRKPGCA